MVVLQSGVIIVRQPCQAHTVGGTMILPLFAMFGQVADIRNGKYGSQPTKHSTRVH